jgi:anti-anti-sigma factor
MSVGTPAVSVVALIGDHDFSTTVELQRTLVSLIEEGRPVVVDLSGVSFAQSTILSALILASKQADRTRFVVVAPPNRPAARLLDLIDAGAIFPVFEALEPAVDWCRSGRSDPHDAGRSRGRYHGSKCSPS